MAQPPEGTMDPFLTLDLEAWNWILPLPTPTEGQLPPGCVFRPKARCLLDDFLIPRALEGVVEHNLPDCIAEGVDVYAVPPSELPFPARNRDRHRQVWGYFFTTRPVTAAAAGGGSSAGSGGGDQDDDDDDVREVAAGGGRWERYGDEKEYVGDDGSVFAFRRRFQFRDAGDDDDDDYGWTNWRMTEFRLNEAAPAFRGVAFHPSASGLVVCRIDNKVDPEELEPELEEDYYPSDDDEEDDDGYGVIVISEGEFISAPAAAAA